MAERRRPSRLDEAYRRKKAAEESVTNSSARTPRRRRMRMKLRAKVLLVVMALLFVAGVVRLVSPADDGVEILSENPVSPSMSGQQVAIQSDAGILVDMESDKVYYNKKADEKHYPASLTKLMTLYVALQENKDLKRTVVVPEAAFQNLEKEDLAVAGLIPGEALPLEDVLYAMILPSGADAAQTLALISADDMGAFVRKMNQAAEKLGMTNTYFTNATGAHNPKQVTTAKDMALLLREGMKNKTFRQVVTAKSHTTAPTAQHPKGLSFSHTVAVQEKIFADELKRHPYNIIGGKTGYTPEAGLCLASVARSTDGRQAIAVTLRARGDTQNYHPVFEDAMHLYDIIFDKK